MTTRPARGTVKGRRYLDLQRLARRQGRPTDELHQLYALEGFLQRLAASQYRERLVLKGGVLLAAYDARRPTRDIDLQAQGLNNDPGSVGHVVLDIVSVRLPAPDGLVFDAKASPHGNPVSTISTAVSASPCIRGSRERESFSTSISTLVTRSGLRRERLRCRDYSAARSHCAHIHCT
jgi:Nucleotidyl transferase AbiEii toxin, Type IV TA system